MTRDINADFAHCRDSFRLNLSWGNAGAHYFKTIAGEMTQQAFSHLASCRVAGAQYQNAFTVCHNLPPQQALVALDVALSTLVPHSHGAVSARLSSSTTNTSHSFPSGSCTQVLSCSA